MFAPDSDKRKQDILWSAVILLIGFAGGLLAILILPSILANKHPRYVRDIVETTQLDLAVKCFKERFGEYPPDFGEETKEQKVAAVKRFLKKVFPKCPEVNYLPEFQDPAKFDTQKFNPATALVFWLGGMQNADGQPNGFSADPQKPFDSVATHRIGPFYAFNLERIQSPNGGAKYYPASYQGDFAQGCYVYFRAEEGSYAGKTYADAGDSGAMQDTKRNSEQIVAYMNPTSFQIRSFGADGRWGTTPETRWGVMFPDGLDYNPENYDDIGNFCSEPFEKEMPQNRPPPR